MLCVDKKYRMFVTFKYTHATFRASNFRMDPPAYSYSIVSTKSEGCILCVADSITASAVQSNQSTHCRYYIL